MAEGDRPVRLQDVAEAAGVSKGTASNVFNRPELVREEVRERVRRAAESLGYAGPDPKARLLQAGRANSIGIAADEPLSYFFTDPWMRRLLVEVAAVCNGRGAGIALVSMAGGRPLSWGVDTAIVDGFLLRRGGRELLVEMTQRRGLPYVALSMDASEPNVPAVGIDDYGGARAAARHLLDLGHRRFAVIGIALGVDPGPMTPDAVRTLLPVNVRERSRGYWAALAEAGIGETDVPFHAVRLDAQGVGAAIDALFKEPCPPPTALLVMSDRIAVRAVDELATRGLRVPADVSVVGFDGTPESAEARPALTTVEQPYQRIAERVVAALLDAETPAEDQALPVSLVIRQSTGAAPGRRGGS